MERSHLKFRHTVMSLFIFLICLLTFSTQARQLSVALSALNSNIITEHVQSGLQSELTRQGYMTGANFTWIDNQNKLKLSNANVTISNLEHNPFITLINQQGLATEIKPDEIVLYENRDNHLIEHYEVDFIKKLLPDINTLGVILDQNVVDINSVNRFFAEQDHDEIRIITYYIDSAAELRSTTRALASQADAIYLPFHITDMPELAQIVTVAERNDVALIGADHRSINKGIFAVYNIDYFQVGRDTADLLVRLVEGSDALDSSNSNGNHYVAQPVLSLNLDAAVRMGIDLSVEVIDKATFIIK